MNQLLISFILLARLAAPAPGFAANSNPDWYCHNFLDTTTASALVYEEISCMLNGAQVWVWNFGSRSQASIKNPNAVAVNPIYYPVYPTGASAGSPVVEYIPCDDGYSDAWLKILVTVTKKTVYNSVKEKSAFDPYYLATGKIKGLVNLPMVPLGSTLSGQTSVNTITAWYLGRPVTLFDLGNFKASQNSITSLTPYQEVDILDSDSNILTMILESGAVNSPMSFYTRNSLQGLSFLPTSYSEISNQPYSPLSNMFFFNYPLAPAPLISTTSTTTTTTTSTTTTTTATSSTTSTTTTATTTTTTTETTSSAAPDYSTTTTTTNAELATTTTTTTAEESVLITSDAIKTTTESAIETVSVLSASTAAESSLTESEVTTEVPTSKTTEASSAFVPATLSTTSEDLSSPTTQTVSETSATETVESILRCGSDWIDANTNCYGTCTTDSDCLDAAKSKCFIVLALCSGSNASHSSSDVTSSSGDTTSTETESATQTFSIETGSATPTFVETESSIQTESPTASQQENPVPSSSSPESTYESSSASSSSADSLTTIQTVTSSDASAVPSSAEHVVYYVSEWVSDPAESETTTKPAQPKTPTESKTESPVLSISKTDEHKVYYVSEWVPDEPESSIAPISVGEVSSSEPAQSPTATIEETSSETAVVSASSVAEESSSTSGEVVLASTAEATNTDEFDNANNQAKASNGLLSTTREGVDTVTASSADLSSGTENSQSTGVEQTQTPETPSKAPEESYTDTHKESPALSTTAVDVAASEHSVYYVTEWVPDPTNAPEPDANSSQSVNSHLPASTADQSIATTIEEPSATNLASEQPKATGQTNSGSEPTGSPFTNSDQHSVYYVTEWVPEETETEEFNNQAKPSKAALSPTAVSAVEETKSVNSGEHSVYYVTEWVPDTTDDAEISPINHAKASNGISESPTIVVTKTKVDPSTTRDAETQQTSIGTDHQVYYITTRIRRPRTTTYTNAAGPQATDVPTSGGDHSVYLVSEWVPEDPAVTTTAQEHSVYYVTEWIPDESTATENQPLPTVTDKAEDHPVYYITQRIRRPKSTLAAVRR